MSYGRRSRSGTSVSGWTKRAAAGNTYGVATGGTAISPDPVINGVTYRVLQFTALGTLTVTKAGLFDVLVFAGGGAGGATFGQSLAGGGGGGSHYLQTTIYCDANVSIVVGGGGSAGAVPTCGSMSYVGALVAIVGGGPGGTYTSDAYRSTEGCFSNGGGQSASGNGGRSRGFWAVNGADGGQRSGVYDYYRGAGGGSGAGGVGGDGTTNNNAVGGNGGAGYDVSAFIGGGSLFKGAGGGGGGHQTGGSGGSSVGGNGGTQNNSGMTSASANTASGGGGVGTNYNAGSVVNGGAGGAGIVYVRFKV